FVDQPCGTAPSVVSDNHRGARELTMHLLGQMPANDANDPSHHLYFLGGAVTSHATTERLSGFRDAAASKAALFGDHQIMTCGYDPAHSRDQIEELHSRLGQLPSGLFVNSISSFDGVAQFLRALSADAMSTCVIGCYDYEPFGTLLSFPVHMVRQRSDEIIGEALRHFDEADFKPGIVRISPELLLAD
ncbi:MAG: LacI family DNA-binding transcriptional regulator, partial [Geminicoccaceae bacterium]